MYTFSDIQVMMVLQNLQIYIQTHEKKNTAKVPMYAKINNIPYIKPIKKKTNKQMQKAFQKRKERDYKYIMFDNMQRTKDETS